jgi:hypothetical protein
MLPQPAFGSNGLVLDHFAPARTTLLDDLRSDEGMEWIPDRAWLTKVQVDAEAAQLQFDLAIDTSAARAPSAVDAGLTPLAVAGKAAGLWVMNATLLLAVGGLAVVVLLNHARLGRGATI